MEMHCLPHFVFVYAVIKFNIVESEAKEEKRMKEEKEEEENNNTNFYFHT